MDIVYKNNERTDFCSVNIGLPILYKGEIFIKIETSKSPEDLLINAINLSNGKSEYISESSYVDIVTAKIVIK